MDDSLTPLIVESILAALEDRKASTFREKRFNDAGQTWRLSLSQFQGKVYLRLSNVRTTTANQVCKELQQRSIPLMRRGRYSNLILIG